MNRKRLFGIIGIVLPIVVLILVFSIPIMTNEGKPNLPVIIGLCGFFIYQFFFYFILLTEGLEQNRKKNTVLAIIGYILGIFGLIGFIIFTINYSLLTVSNLPRFVELSMAYGAVFLLLHFLYSLISAIIIFIQTFNKKSKDDIKKDLPVKKGILAMIYIFVVLAAGVVGIILGTHVVTAGTAVKLSHSGEDHFYEKDYDQAIADYTEAIRLNPSYAEAYYRRGRAYHGKEDYDQAIADFTEAIKLNPRKARVWSEASLEQYYCYRGEAYYDKKDYDKAIADFTEAIKLYPRYAEAYINRGRAYRNNVDYDKAIADYTEAIMLNSIFYNAEAYINRGIIYLEQKDYDKAIADFTDAIKRGYITYLFKDDYDKVIADFTEAIKIDPRIAESYYGRGIIYLEKKDYDKAIADFEAALAINPDYAEAKEALELAKRARGD